MWNLLGAFWREDHGYVAGVEWMLVASILTLGAFATLLTIHTF